MNEPIQKMLPSGDVVTIDKLMDGRVEVARYADEICKWSKTFATWDEALQVYESQV